MSPSTAVAVLFDIYLTDAGTETQIEPLNINLKDGRENNGKP